MVGSTGCVAALVVQFHRDDTEKLLVNGKNYLYGNCQLGNFEETVHEVQASAFTMIFIFGHSLFILP